MGPPSYRSAVSAGRSAAYPPPVTPNVRRVVPVPDVAAAPVVVRAGRTTVVTAEPVEVVEVRGEAAFDTLDGLTPGWWAGFLAYDLGRSVERVAPRLPDDLGLPDLLLARFDARLVLGDGEPRFMGPRRARARLEELVDRAPRPSDVAPLGLGTSSLDRDAFEAGVRAIVALIESGECYQVNLTRRLAWDEPVDGLALFAALRVNSPAPHAALLTLPRRDDPPVTVVSASPERFLSWQGREVETRPIKGTASDSAVLRTSAKDRAENVMIVDLARNDLGRVCEYGSVQVSGLCEVEQHPGLCHLVSTVRGVRRAGTGVGDLVRGDVPARVGHGRTQATGAPGDRGPRAGAARRLLRRGRVARHRARRGRTSPSRSAVTPAPTVGRTSASAAASWLTPTPAPSGRRPSSRPRASSPRRARRQGGERTK